MIPSPNSSPTRSVRGAAALLLTALLALGAALAQPAPADLAGVWRGVIGPGTLELEVAVEFAVDAGELTGTIDIPAQGAQDLPLEGLELGGDALRFAIAGVPGDPTFDGVVEGDPPGAVAGTFTQGGQELEFRLERSGEADEADASAADAPAPVPAPPELLGDWQGAIGPSSLDVGVVLSFADEEGALAGTIDIPAQGFEDGALEIVAADAGAVTARIVGVPGEPTFELTLEGGALAGEFRQSGQTFPVRLEPGGEAPGAARPQEPQPPFPYEATEVTYPSGDVTLAGTLTLPEGAGPFPGVLLVSGSGPQDRDEALAGHRPFAVLADHLTRAGVAVLRFDDRGVGGSGGELYETDYDVLVGDVLAGLERLRAEPAVDPERVGVLGHSEGAYLAPLAAQRDPQLAFAVLMAGPAAPGLEVLLLQNELIFELEGASEAELQRQTAFLEALAAAVAAEDYEAARELTAERVGEQFDALPDAERPDDAALAAVTEGQQAYLASPYFRAFVLHDPQPSLRALAVPTLAVFGRRDIQVPLAQNEGPMRGALRVAPAEDTTVLVFDGLNHLMQPAGSGALGEYASIETTLAPEFLEAVTGWITERFAE